MGTRTSPERERYLAGVNSASDAWSSERCLEVAAFARRFKPALERERQREIFEAIACRLEECAAAKAAHGP